jgi:Tol biopolymer transport system component
MSSTEVNLVSVASTGALGNGVSGRGSLAITRDGNLVGFFSQANNLYGGTGTVSNYVVKNMQAGAVTRLTLAINGDTTNGISGGAEAGLGELALTADGRYAAFGCSSTLAVAGDISGEDIFRRDIQTGSTLLASSAHGGVKSYHSFEPDISDNGRYIVFSSMDNLVAGMDRNTATDTDIFWYDTLTNTMKLVSGALNGSVQGEAGGYDADSELPQVTNDGRYVVFSSQAENLVNAGSGYPMQVFLRDMVDDTIAMLSASATGVAGNGYSEDCQITPDGKYVVFASEAHNLSDAFQTGFKSILRMNLATGDVQMVNTSADGNLHAADRAAAPQITPDGRYVVFESLDSTLVPGNTTTVNQVYVKDMVTGNIALASTTATGAPSSKGCYVPQISDDGQYIVFYTEAALVASDTNGYEDVYRVLNPIYASGTSLDDDVFCTSPERETIVAGAGLDRVIFSENRADYTIVKNAGGLTVTGQVTDTLTGVERLYFWDTNLAFDLTPEGNAGMAREFIGSIAYGLIDDPAVMGAILNIFDQGVSMNEICQLAIDVGLTQALAGSSSNADLARLVYRNVIGGEADAAMTNMLVGFMDGTYASYTQSQFLATIAAHELNQAHIELTGVQTAGVEYVI